MDGLTATLCSNALQSRRRNLWKLKHPPEICKNRKFSTTWSCFGVCTAEILAACWLLYLKSNWHGLSTVLRFKIITLLLFVTHFKLKFSLISLIWLNIVLWKSWVKQFVVLYCCCLIHKKDLNLINLSFYKV